MLNNDAPNSFDEIIKARFNDGASLAPADSSLENRVIQTIREYKHKRKQRQMILSFCLSGLAFASIVALFCWLTAGDITIQVIEGEGEIVLNSKTTHLDHTINPLKPGSKINSQDNQLIVQLSDQTRIIMNNGTVCSFIDQKTVKFDGGQIRYINHSPDVQTTFLIPDGSIKTLGTEFDLILSSSELNLNVIDGAVYVETNGKSYTVSVGQMYDSSNPSSPVQKITAPVSTWWNYQEEVPWTEYLHQQR